MRLGPRPLALHLALATSGCVASNAALPLLNGDSTRWSPALRDAATALRAEVAAALGEASPDLFAAAVDREGRRRLDRFLAGVACYRRHPYRRALSDPPPLWSQGAARLYGFGDCGPPVLLVPSLVNRAYILDLGPRRSFARWLAARGFRVFLLDWGLPGARERGFGLSDYICGPLAGALDAVRSRCGQRVAVLGYCMGGLLALALALRRPDAVGALALMATPWDFHAEDARQARVVATVLALFAAQTAALGWLPTDAIQAMFCALDPFLGLRKFSAFADLDPDSAAARRFVALEDWLNDGVPLAAPVALECARDWYGANAPARGLWRVAGQAVDPAAFDRPACVMVPAADRIVPPASAEALARALPGAAMLRPRAGHIGMIAGRGVTRTVWTPLADWLAGNA